MNARTKLKLEKVDQADAVFINNIKSKNQNKKGFLNKIKKRFSSRKMMAIRKTQKLSAKVERKTWWQRFKGIVKFSKKSDTTENVEQICSEILQELVEEVATKESAINDEDESSEVQEDVDDENGDLFSVKDIDALLQQHGLE
jgi:hypothetical protein